MNKPPAPQPLDRVLENRWALLLFNLFMLALAVGALFLPPFSLGKQPTPASTTALNSQVWSAADPDGTELTVLTMRLPDDASPVLELTSVPRADLLTGTADEALLPIVQALPSRLTIKSPLYQVRAEGMTPKAATLRIPIPNDAEPLRTLDVYGWSGEGWYRLDGRVREAKDDILVRLATLPEALAVVQTRGMDPILSAPLRAGQPLSQEQIDALDEIHPYAGLVTEDGRVLKEPSFSGPAVPSLRVIPSVRNWTETDGVWRGRVDSILYNETLRQAHVKALSQFVAQGNYAGVDIDYRGLMPESRAAFSQFIADLTQVLHPQGKLVSVRVSLPTAITSDQWDTGPYDWPALSQVVDILRAPMPVDPRAYRPDGQAHAFLDWAVGEADRYRLQLVFMPLAVAQADSALTTLPYGEALALLTQLETTGVPQTVVSSDQIYLELPVLQRSSGLLYDESLHTWWFTYLDEHHHSRAVWLNNAEGLPTRAALATSYHLRGISVEGLTEPGNDPNLWTAVRALREATTPPVSERFSLQWQVTGPGGPSVTEMPLSAENAAYTWTAPSAEGTYQLALSVAQDDQPIVTSELLPMQVVSAIALVTPTPIPTTIPPTATPTSVPATPTPTSTPTSAPPTATPIPTPTTIPPTATPTSVPPPTPTFTPAPPPTPAFLEAPTLFEPESGAYFPKEVRLKWTWFRRLENFEKFAVRWEPVGSPDLGDWWVDEPGIFGGGGAIHEIEGGYLFEVNFGLSRYPEGEAYWSVAVFGEKSPEEKWQISDWSERRQIFHGKPPR